MKTVIFDIQRFCVNDGPGIRSTVFFKGCMMNCLWCHNPESKSFKPTLMLNEKYCSRCMKCGSICDNHSFNENNLHIINRNNCSLCNKCVDVCNGALKICGVEMSVDEVFNEIIKDIDFYKNSCGGITLSGGEPLVNVRFAKELLKKCKNQNIHTAVETAGYIKWENILEIKPFVDLFLWDIKETNNIFHKKYTNVDNELIIENLKKLNSIGAEIILRCPIIPGYNDREDHFEAIGKMAEELENVIEINILPYHPLGKEKSVQIGEEYLLGDLTFSDNNTIDSWITAISRYTSKKVKKA